MNVRIQKHWARCFVVSIEDDDGNIETSGTYQTWQKARDHGLAMAHRLGCEMHFVGMAGRHD